MTIALPRLYAILDAELLAQRGIAPLEFAAELYEAGIRCMQYRDKTAPPAKTLETLRVLRATLPPPAILIANDRADLCVLAGCDGLHIGQEDVSPVGARRVIGDRLLGISTHNDEQISLADQSGPSYVAIGPVFATSSKADPDPVVSLDGVRSARRLTSKPLVAIGGITHANARSVIDGGADSVAVISALVPRSANESVRKLAEDFLQLFL